MPLLKAFWSSSRTTSRGSSSRRRPLASVIVSQFLPMTTIHASLSLRTFSMASRHSMPGSSDPTSRKILAG